MNCTPITEENIEKVAMLYMNHYNQHSGGCWTYEKAYKRIHQMVTMEDSLCLMQEDDNDIPTGLVIGFLESYDDFTFYYLDEILISGVSEQGVWQITSPRSGTACAGTRRTDD